MHMHAHPHVHPHHSRAGASGALDAASAALTRSAGNRGGAGAGDGSIGGSYRTLRRRWYYLQQNFLFWYSNHCEGLPRGVLFLEGSLVRPIPDAAAEAKGFYGFGITTSSSHGDRTRVLYAHGAGERDEWLSLLRAACATSPFDDDYALGRCVGEGKFSRVYEATRRRRDAEHSRDRARVAGAGMDGHAADAGAGAGAGAASPVADSEQEQERFAVKVIAKGSLSESERELLRSEIAILKLVQHPHIVRYEAVYETAGEIYIVMELLKGGELFGNIVGRSRFSEEEARALIRPLVDVVAYLAALGCVHRDIKPENILCSGSGSTSGSGSGSGGFSWGDIKIADFGLSALIHPGEVLTQPCGTLQYAAPEVLSRSGYGKPADMWSLGVLLYLVVRGKLPFDHEDKEALIAAILGEPIDFSHPVWARWSPEGLAFARSLLERDPGKRLTARGALQHPWLRSSAAERERRSASGAAAAAAAGAT